MNLSPLPSKVTHQIDKHPNGNPKSHLGETLERIHIRRTRKGQRKSGEASQTMEAWNRRLRRRYHPGACTTSEASTERRGSFPSPSTRSSSSPSSAPTAGNSSPTNPCSLPSSSSSNDPNVKKNGNLAPRIEPFTREKRTNPPKEPIETRRGGDFSVMRRRGCVISSHSIHSNLVFDWSSTVQWSRGLASPPNTLCYVSYLTF